MRRADPQRQHAQHLEAPLLTCLLVHQLQFLSERYEDNVCFQAHRAEPLGRSLTVSLRRTASASRCNTIEG